MDNTKRPVNICIYGTNKAELSAMAEFVEDYDFVSVEGMYADGEDAADFEQREALSKMLDRYSEGDIDCVLILSQADFIGSENTICRTLKEFADCEVKAYNLATERIIDYADLWGTLVSAAEEILSCAD